MKSLFGSYMWELVSSKTRLGIERIPVFMKTPGSGSYRSVLRIYLIVRTDQYSLPSACNGNELISPKFAMYLGEVGHCVTHLLFCTLTFY